MEYTSQLLQCTLEWKQYVPSTPLDLRLRQAGVEGVTVEWTPGDSPVDASDFHIYYRRATDTNWRRVSTSGATSAMLTDLSRNTQYVVVVVAANAAGTSDPSRPLTFTNQSTRQRDQQPPRRRKSRNNARHHHHQHANQD
jgi:hypothetical protein